MRVEIAFSYRWCNKISNTQMREIRAKMNSLQEMLGLSSHNDIIIVNKLMVSIDKHIRGRNTNVAVYSLIFHPTYNYNHESEVTYILRQSDLKYQIALAYNVFRDGDYPVDVTVFLDHLFPSASISSMSEAAIMSFLHVNKWLLNCGFILTVYILTGVIESAVNVENNTHLTPYVIIPLNVYVTTAQETESIFELPPRWFRLMPAHIA